MAPDACDNECEHNGIRPTRLAPAGARDLGAGTAHISAARALNDRLRTRARRSAARRHESRSSSAGSLRSAPRTGRPLAKIKSILLLLPKVKLLVTAGTMVVSIAAYATIWGFPFAFGFVILLLVHEMGHVIALRREGIKASWPMFIPFLGALISARSLGDNALAEARVGLAGPILGEHRRRRLPLVWLVTGHDFWRALAFTGLFLNLFNLLPVVPLDGGRAMAAMTPWMWFVGFAGIVVAGVRVPQPDHPDHRRAGRVRDLQALAASAGTAAWSSSPTTASARATASLVGAVYLGLVALLVIGMDATHLPRTLG